MALVKPKKNNDQAKRKSRKTPFADVGEILGGAANALTGKMFGLDLKGPGRWLGSGIGSIFGSGDYTIMGQAPQNNVLFNSREIPKFSSTRATNVICHREYIQDWTGTAAFTNSSYRLNPGDVKTFPWLSQIAENYQQYKFHGIIFEFKPLITDFVTGGAPGVVVMATNYNANDPAYESKQDMENSEFAVSVKPTNNLVHGIECAVDQTSTPIKYVRNNSADSGDARLYDLGTFQFANQGSPVQILGEIWVSYCVEFFKPQQPATPGGSVFSAINYRSGPGNADPLGATFISTLGNMNLATTNRDIFFDALPEAHYLIDIEIVGSSNSASQPTATSPDSTLVFVPKIMSTIGNFSNTSATFTTVGSTVTVSHIFAYVRCQRTSPGRANLNFATNGLEPFGAAGTVTITVTQVDETLF